MKKSKIDSKTEQEILKKMTKTSKSSNEAPINYLKSLKKKRDFKKAIMQEEVLGAKNRREHTYVVVIEGLTKLKFLSLDFHSDAGKQTLKYE
jgi:hypothetical protein